MITYHSVLLEAWNLGIDVSGEWDGCLKGSITLGTSLEVGFRLDFLNNLGNPKGILKMVDPALLMEAAC